MGILSGIKESMSGFDSPKQWLVNFFGGGSTTSGVNVNEEKAMQFSAVYNAVQIYAFTLASLPLFLYQREDEGKSKATQHHLYKKLHDQPNPEMTSWSYRTAKMAHILLWGNGYSEIEYDNAGRVKGLWPLLPNKTWPMRDKETQKLYYVTTLPNGKRVSLDKKRVLHIPGLGFNGIQGRSIISFAREGIGLGLATEKYGASFFGNDSTPGGVLQHPEQLSDGAHNRLRNDWERKHQGLDNKHRVAILEEGMEWKQIGIPPEDAQFLETRKFQVTEIARWFNLPPHMLKDLDRATFSNIEQQSLEFVIYSLLPWLKNWEQSINKDLVANDKFFAEFVVDGLLRGDIESRYNAYAVGRQWGWLSTNDIRKLENMNEIEGGDTYLQPLNMIPIDQSENNPKLESNSKPLTPEERQRKIKEVRAQRSATTRRNIRQRYESVIKTAADKIVERETNKIQDLVNKELKNRSDQSFRDKMVKFYREFPEEIQQEMKPVLRSLADDIAEEAANEIDIDDYDIDEFFEDFAENQAESYAGYSRGQLLALMDEAIEEDKDPVELVEQRLEEWEEKRAEKTAKRESVKVDGAITRQVFAAGGIKELIWVANPDACPICQEMDGKTVGIEEEFMTPGDEIDAEDKGFSPSGIITHPPLHDECECGIAAN